MNQKQVATKNYIIITLIFIATIALTLYLCNCYNVYNDSKKGIPVIRGIISEITSEDFEHYIMENQTITVYMCTASDNKCRDYENSFIKLIKKKELQEEFVYLNLSDVDLQTFTDEFNKKYKCKKGLTTNYPALVMFENGEVSSILQEDKNETLTISKTKNFIELNKIGE